MSTNMRLDAVHAIALMLKLKHLDEDIRSRRKTAARYDHLLQDAGLPLQPVRPVAGAEHVYHLYVVQSLAMDRDLLMQKLADKGIGTAVHYPVPVYRQPFYTGKADPCPVTDAVSARILSLPFFPDITEDQQSYVVDSLKGILK
jgi:perosamine synthetase